MTIEDAITSPTPVWVPPRVHTAWNDLWGYQGDGSVDDLTQQQGVGATIGHSFDDGLPDSVTLTSSADAVGTLSMDLVGRGPFIATQVGWRTGKSGTQHTAASAVNAQWPDDLQMGDLVITTFAVCPNVDDDIILSDSLDPPDTLGRRDTKLIADYLGTGSSGGVRILVYATIAPPDQAGFFLALEWENVTNYRWAWSSNAVYARQGGFNVGIRPGPSSFVATPGTDNAITGLTIDLTGPRGYVYSAWATRDTTLTGTDTQEANVISADPSFSDIRLLTQRTGIVTQGIYTRSVTKGASNEWELGVGIPLIIDDRPAMDPRQYFSPFNELSPVVSYPRDVSPVTYDFGVLTSDGPDYERLFTGQMTDVPVKSRSAGLSALSRARILMMRSVKPPLVWAAREGANMSWILSWIWYQCGLAVAPLPSKLTKLWMPLHGSIHPHWGEPITINAYQHDPLGQNQPITPIAVKGSPFLMGMYGEFTTTRTVENRVRWGPRYTSPTYNREAGGGTLRDLLSKNGGVGRFSAWIRGDAAMTTTASYSNPATTLMRGFIQLQDISPFLDRAGIEYGINILNRRLYMRFYDSSGNDTGWTATTALPADGEWHFIAFNWNWMAGTMSVNLDGVVETKPSPVTTDDNDLPDDERAYIASSSSGFGPGNLVCTNSWVLPMSDVYIDSGTTANIDEYVRDVVFTPDVITRPLDTTLEAIIEPVAREAWAIMVDIAQANLAWYRANELDQIEFLPLGYFGEDAQMTPIEVVIDTETNAEDPDVIRDPTRIRNNVTVTFEETRVDDTLSPVLEYTTSTPILPGTTQVTFPLDTTMIQPLVSATLTNLNDAQVTAGTIPAGVSYMTVNSLADGTGVYYTSAQVSGRVVSFASDSITIEFKNTTGLRRYLANDGSDVPFLGALGYAVRTSTGYVTTTDDWSVTRRGERTLSAQIPYIQKRADATMISGWLTSMLCDPTASVEVTVFGDPTRKPGQLVMMRDRQGTSLGGTWRIMSVTHSKDSAAYTQKLSLVQWGSVAEWDSSLWDDGSVWGE